MPGAGDPASNQPGLCEPPRAVGASPQGWPATQGEGWTRAMASGALVNLLAGAPRLPLTVPPRRMNREQFFAKLATLEERHLKKGPVEPVLAGFRVGAWAHRGSGRP
jgi:hypothetical protein